MRAIAEKAPPVPAGMVQAVKPDRILAPLPAGVDDTPEGRALLQAHADGVPAELHRPYGRMLLLVREEGRDGARLLLGELSRHEVRRGLSQRDFSRCVGYLLTSGHALLDGDGLRVVR